MRIGWLGLALITGMLVPAQAAMNARMRTFVINPFYSAMINFSVGALALITVIVFMLIQQQPGNLRGSASAPWWAWCGGFIGASLVVGGVLIVPRTGAATYSVALITGQLLGALLLDHYGWLGLPTRPLTPPRLVGALILLLGVWLIQRN